MGLTSIIALFILFLAIVFMVFGVSSYRKANNNPNKSKPTLLGYSALLLQLLLISLYFTEILPNINETIVDILWWGVVLYGFVIGIRETKYNIFVSFLSIFLSVLLAILMILGIFITSM